MSTLRKNSPDVGRRRFLHDAGIIAAMTLLPFSGARAQAQETVTLPFENGRRRLVKYPQKRPLIVLTSRPPQLETPFAVFNESLLTPNDAFFVRYHLSDSPPLEVNLDSFRLELKGAVNRPLSFSIADLKSQFEPVEIVAVNQCSGNSRGFFQPRVAGGQLANGAMGNAGWKGVPLKALLDRAGLAATAAQVTFNGLDNPVIDKTPDFIKALSVDQAADGEVMLAYEMNGEDLPMLNGYPLRLVVPGYFGTYWVKHLNEIQVVDKNFTGFWMNPAYRIPDNAGACVDPGVTPKSTLPINRLNIRSFITSLADGAVHARGREMLLRGIAFDGGYGIAEVVVSSDGGQNWRQARIGKDHGKYSFREWTIALNPEKAGPLELKVRATNRIGQTQPMEPLWNPAGYMRNVVETVKVQVV